MITKTTIPFALTAILYLTACSAEEAKKEKTTETSSFEKTSNEDIDPCEVITKEDITALMQPQTEISLKDSRSSFPTCTYVWKTATDGPFQYMGREMKTFLENKVMIIVGSTTATEESYDRSIGVYKDMETVDGLGDKAVWSSQRNQVTVMSGALLFHVHVESFESDKTNKEYALELAKMFIEKN